MRSRIEEEYSTLQRDSSCSTWNIDYDADGFRRISNRLPHCLSKVMAFASLKVRSTQRSSGGDCAEEEE